MGAILPKVVLPRDERAHRSDYEWWYAHGYLRNESGHQFGFMFSFFSFAKAAVVRHFPQFARYPWRRIHQLHLGLTDITHQTHHQSELTYLPWSGHVGTSRRRMRIRYGANVLQQIDHKRFELIAEHRDMTLHLHMHDTKSPIPHGSQGRVSVPREGFTLYYSRPRLTLEGELHNRRAQHTEYVHGSAWMDHQWGDLPPGQKFMLWDWLGIQLSDGSELMIYRFIDRAGRDRVIRTTYVAPDSKVSHPRASIRYRRTWQSAKSGIAYPVDLDIKIPTLKLTLHVEAAMHDQEMHSWFFPYWEGVCTVRGMRGKHPVRGQAYLEMIGYNLIPPQALRKRLRGTRAI